MSATYQHLALTDVRPGMILSDELLDQQGHVLLPAGAVLSAATIALLPNHGIDALAVLCDPATAQAHPTAPAPDVITQRLAKLFRKNDIDNQDDWATGILRRYIEDFRLEREIGP